MIPENVWEEHKEMVKILRACYDLVSEFMNVAVLSGAEASALYAFMKWLKRQEDL